MISRSPLVNVCGPRSSTSASSRIGLAVSGRNAKPLVIPGSPSGRVICGISSQSSAGCGEPINNANALFRRKRDVERQTRSKLTRSSEMRIRAGALSVLAVLTTAAGASAQDWSFDARDIAMGGVGTTGNLATKMIAEQRDYTSIVLPFGLIQVFKDMNIYNPDSKNFDPVRAIEYAASPMHYGLDRGRTNTGEALFVSDLRNATLSRDLSRYKGFVP